MAEHFSHVRRKKNVADGISLKIGFQCQWIFAHGIAQDVESHAGGQRKEQFPGGGDKPKRCKRSGMRTRVDVHIGFLPGQHGRKRRMLQHRTFGPPGGTGGKNGGGQVPGIGNERAGQLLRNPGGVAGYPVTRQIQTWNPLDFPVRLVRHNSCYPGGFRNLSDVGIRCVCRYANVSATGFQYGQNSHNHINRSSGQEHNPGGDGRLPRTADIVMVRRGATAQSHFPKAGGHDG